MVSQMVCFIWIIYFVSIVTSAACESSHNKTEASGPSSIPSQSFSISPSLSVQDAKKIEHNIFARIASTEHSSLRIASESTSSPPSLPTQFDVQAKILIEISLFEPVDNKDMSRLQKATASFLKKYVPRVVTGETKIKVQSAKVLQWGPIEKSSKMRELGANSMFLVKIDDGGGGGGGDLEAVERMVGPKRSTRANGSDPEGTLRKMKKKGRPHIIDMRVTSIISFALSPSGDPSQLLYSFLKQAFLEFSKEYREYLKQEVSSFEGKEALLIDHPSASPSIVPTTSSQPSSVPSGNPSSAPSISSQPSSMPSQTPSVNPTISLKPSNYPSENPSEKPSVSYSPTSRPSAMPSIEPSTIPSSDPSTIPSLIPSYKPSNWPTSFASLTPSSAPIADPSFLPTSIPTSIPSPLPSFEPSMMPVLLLSFAPSFKASFMPSTMPSSTLMSVPSFLPSNLSTSPPSSAPSSMLPSGHPLSSKLGASEDNADIDTKYGKNNTSSLSSPPTRGNEFSSDDQNDTVASESEVVQSVVTSLFLPGIASTMNQSITNQFETVAQEYASSIFFDDKVYILSVDTVDQAVINVDLERTHENERVRGRVLAETEGLAITIVVVGRFLSSTATFFNFAEDIREGFAKENMGEFQDKLMKESAWFDPIGRNEAGGSLENRGQHETILPNNAPTSTSDSGGISGAGVFIAASTVALVLSVGLLLWAVRTRKRRGVDTVIGRCVGEKRKYPTQNKQKTERLDGGADLDNCPSSSDLSSYFQSTPLDEAELIPDAWSLFDVAGECKDNEEKLEPVEPPALQRSYWSTLGFNNNEEDHHKFPERLSVQTGAKVPQPTETITSSQIECERDTHASGLHIRYGNNCSDELEVTLRGGLEELDACLWGGKISERNASKGKPSSTIAEF